MLINYDSASLHKNYLSLGSFLNKKITLSLIIPCYNEEQTLQDCIEKVLEIRENYLELEIIIVDDCSTDNSYKIAGELSLLYNEVRVFKHPENRGKGAAIRTGVKHATGDYVVIQDADLEYDPFDLKNLLVPLITDKADVVIGSRFLTGGAHRVLYFWHSLGNNLLTLISNMFTDLNLTDMETCYKLFKRSVIQNIEIEEDRFGFEPEIIAKVAHSRLRIYEMGISYYGRTYDEGKKIGARDGFRALYCIFRYNAHKAPLPVQFIIYTFIGALSALFNLFVFLGLNKIGLNIDIAILSAFGSAALLNYYLSIKLLFRHKAKWNSGVEILVYSFVVVFMAIFDLNITKLFLLVQFSPQLAKITASAFGLFLNFIGRRFLVFPEPSSGSWQPQNSAGIPGTIDHKTQKVKITKLKVSS